MFSRCLLDTVRAHDAVGRYGGEEFLIVVTDCSEDDLSHRAEQLRAAIHEDVFVTSNGVLGVTMSVGAISIQEWGESHPIEPILAEIDAALYQAKALGRNQVVCASRPIFRITLAQFEE